MPEETIDPALLEQTKNQIRKLVAEIDELAESDLQPHEFYPEFLKRVVSAVAASGGALWLLDGKGSLRLQYQLEMQATGVLHDPARAQPHNALLGCMMQASQPQIVPPGAVVEGVPGAGNPTEFALILAPLMLERQIVGLVEVMMDPARRAVSQKSTVRFISDLCDLAGRYLKNRQMRQIMSQQQLWGQLENFTQAIHSSLDLRETSYAVANEGKRLIGCDRLSVALKVGGRVVVEAVSGQEIVEQKSNQVRELTRLCRAVVRSGEDLVYSGDTESFPPAIRDALELYVDESGSKALIITLLHKPEFDPDRHQEPGHTQEPERVPFGCLVAEQIGDEMVLTDTQARMDVVSRHASTALWNSRDHDRIFLRPMLKAIGTPARFFRGRTLAKILAVLGLILTTILVMAFVPWQLTIEGKGSLLPEERRLTYAPNRGTIAEVFVEHGDFVEQGDPLVRLQSLDLERELNRLTAELQAALNQQAHLQNQIARGARHDEREQLLAQRHEARIKAESARDQIEILREQMDELIVRAPHDGIVTTWEVKKNLLGRPVEIGQELVSIATTDGHWVLEVEVPDNRMGPILEAQKRLESRIARGEASPGTTLGAYFVAATDPERRYPGHVMRIASKAELVEGKHVVKVTVGFADQVRQDFETRNQALLRPGAEVRARVYCGEARLAYVIFRDVIHVFHETVLFRWPFLRS